jgi:acetyltransferase-like isoleucine patch superfamily enzyme
MSELLHELRTYYKKARFLSPAAMPWTRARVQWAFMRRQSYAQWPLYGHVLKAFKEGRLEIDEHVTLMAGCWLALPGEARIRIGRNVYLNGNLMLHAYHLVEIGDFSGIGRGSLVTDAIHRTDDPLRPPLSQGMEVKGPTRIGKRVQIFNNVAVLGGVTIGDRAVVAPNSVVTHDVPADTMVAGVPARVIKRLEPNQGPQPGAVGSADAEGVSTSS